MQPSDPAVAYVNPPMWWRFFLVHPWTFGLGFVVGRDILALRVGPFDFGVERVYELVSNAS